MTPLPRLIASSLLPIPRRVEPLPGSLTLVDQRLLVVDAPTPQALRSTWQRVQRALADDLGLHWEVAAGPAVPTAAAGLTVRVWPEGAGARRHPQGYTLAVTPEGIRVDAATAAGAFYGTLTLLQLVHEFGRELPAVRIEDWPDFPVRGVMLDISRDKVPTLATLYGLVDQLASWKVNQLQLYTEHTFAYRNHPEVWAAASPITGQEILDLDAYCRDRFIDLVPNQNSFGHMTRWLVHPRYAPLAETHASFTVPWGETMSGPFSLCPLDPGSLALVRSLYDELLPHFSSALFNVGCDETFDLGQGRSRDECERRGIGRVYLDYLREVHAEVIARGRTMQFWGDIIVQHPDLVPLLPKDAIALEWGYEADHPFDAHGSQFASAGLPFYVCPGTSSWCSIGGRTANALGNLLNAAENGMRYGAQGYLNTDWGDRGHWQFLPVSYLGFVAGAAYAWALESNRSLDVGSAVSRHAFDDPTGAMGRMASDLGCVHQDLGAPVSNGTALFWALQYSLAELQRFTGVITPAALARTRANIDAAVSPLTEARSGRPDADLTRREFLAAARMLRHACDRVAFVLDPTPQQAAALDTDLGQIVDEYRALWLSRNRPGGLTDSAARLEQARADYRAA
jgi:hexosaminidase